MQEGESVPRTAGRADRGVMQVNACGRACADSMYVEACMYNNDVDLCTGGGRRPGW